MWLSIFVFVLILISLLTIIYKSKVKKVEPESVAEPLKKSVPGLFPQLSSNDKLIIIEGTNYEDIKNVITAFCKMYNKESIKVTPRLIKISITKFAILFPYDVDFEIFCYLVNYLTYPMELKWNVEVTAWTTTTKNDIWITSTTADKKIMIFIPPDDDEYDNVYLLTSENICYKLEFAGEEEKLILQTSKRYTPPDYHMSGINLNEYEDVG